MNTYPSYKDSGVEWIGDIPSGWSSSKFKYISNLFTGNSLNQNQKEQYESDDTSHISYVSSKDINVEYQTVNYNNGLRIPPTDNTLKVCKTKGFLLCVEGGSSGRKMTFLNEDVCFVNKLCCFESSQNTKYQYYFVQTSHFQSKFKISLTGLIGGVSISTLRNFEVPLPPLQEQQQISDYLDYKTSKIDTLLEKTRQKIELLKEQRTSLINTTVTKGLNPNGEMKDSGVEWIGDIPSEWSVKRLKYTSKILPSNVDKHIFPEEIQVRLCNYTDVYYNELIDENTQLTKGSCNQNEYNSPLGFNPLVTVVLMSDVRCSFNNSIFC
jgi:type I restriction enzyme S subunit